VNLILAERIIIESILPPSGSYADLKILSDLRLDLAPNEAEIAESNLRVESVGAQSVYRWDKDAPKDVEIGPRAATIIKEALVALDAAKTLTVAQVPLYERFVLVDRAAKRRAKK